MSEEVKNNIDEHVDETIFDCLNLDNPKSFFLFAGAGSGKTRSLVNVLSRFRDEQGEKLYLNAQKIAVITYTNAACEEIQHRLGYDSLFSVSTIHSFAWELINSFHQDIKKWLNQNLGLEIVDLEEQERKGRAGTKASIDRIKKIASKKDRLESLERIKKFTYNPNGDNRSRGSLDHAEVIKITSDFLCEKPLMQNILIQRYPILLIDESQDTNRLLMDAFFELQQKKKKSFSLGLFGDTMQRIYTDGKVELGQNIPDDWAKPEKQMNHRCPKRVITLINKIRSYVDKKEQVPRVEKEEGFVKLFIVPSSIDNKIEIEKKIMLEMAKVTGDKLWNRSDVKTLTLEHHMAANRMGFLDLFEPLYNHEKLRTGLLDGSLPALKLFTKIVLPLIRAKRDGDEFLVSRIVRKYCPLIDSAVLKKSDNQLEDIREVNRRVNELYSLWSDNKDPKIIDILQFISKSKLFEIPEMLYPIARRTEEEQQIVELEKSIDVKNELIDAWDNALSGSFSQIEAFDEYFSENSKFDTHQGVKGLEFPRVMVIIDDEDARGFLFSYEKLFGAKELTQTDIQNQDEGKDTSIDRTRRLFYVACSRAEKSLAIVAYTKAPEIVQSHVLSEGWFAKDEVIIKS